MKKYILPLVILLCMGLSVVYVNAQEEGVCGENVIWLLADNGTLTISGSGNMTNYRQARDVPWYDKEIYNVVIEEGITSIGSYTMSYMYDVKTVEIPTSVTKIEEYAFACNMAESLDLPDGITYIGECAFAYCEKLTDIVFPDSVTYVGYHVFSASAYESDESNWEKGILYNNKAVISTKHNYMVNNYVIREGVTVIAESAFQSRKCYTISIPDSVQYIGKSAFYSCTSLGNIKIPNGVKEIKKNAFAYCKALKYVIMPDSVELIDISAFEMCNELANVYYRGSEEEWGNVTIKEITQSNKVLGSVKMHYNYNSNMSVSADVASLTVNTILTGNNDYGIVIAMVIKDGTACEIVIKEAQETLQFVFGSECNGGIVKILWLESIEKMKPVCQPKEITLPYVSNKKIMVVENGTETTNGCEITGYSEDDAVVFVVDATKEPIAQEVSRGKIIAYVPDGDTIKDIEIVYTPPLRHVALTPENGASYIAEDTLETVVFGQVDYSTESVTVNGVRYTVNDDTNYLLMKYITGGANNVKMGIGSYAEMKNSCVLIRVKADAPMVISDVVIFEGIN